MMRMTARRVRVFGRVQGVFFRAWTRDEARSLGISGWIRNRSDGSVDAQLEGEPEAIDELIELMREGPPGAHVSNVQIEEADSEGLSGLDARLVGGVRRQIIELPAVDSVAGADLHRLEAVEDVEFGKCYAGNAADPDRLPHEHGVEPPAAAFAPGNGTEFVSALAELLA